MNIEILDKALDVFAIESQSLMATLKQIDSAQFERAMQLLCDAKHIAASGCGHSGIACQHFAHLMCCAGRSARFISPSEALHGAMGYIQNRDVIVLASRGGETDELLQIADICHERGGDVIGITENPLSSLAVKSDVVLTMVVTRECDKDNCQGTTSFVVLSAVFDSLQTAVLEATGFSSEQFAVIHPGGAVGKRLNASGDNSTIFDNGGNKNGF